MKKFDWIDFGYSRKIKWDKKVVDKDFHSSTTSLLSEYLRKKPFGFSKIFLWMTNEGGYETSHSDSVFYIEAPYDFDKYAIASDSDKLSIFADWALSSISNSAPELIDKSDISSLAERLQIEQYIYLREDPVQSLPKSGKFGCKARFLHTPYQVHSEVVCKGANVKFLLPDGLFRRDELDYGKSIESCVVDNEKIVVKTFKGVFSQQRN